MPFDNPRFQAAIGRIDAENALDPNRETDAQGTHPRELLYAQWLTDWVVRLKPGASEALLLAARAQHICRWVIARDSYPHTREGYLKWREALKQLHADKAAEVLRELGYPEETINRVRGLISKRLFPRDEEARVLEDALCLVFLEKQFRPLAAKTADDTMVNALKKAWRKMTPEAQRMALELEYSPKEKALLDKALA